MAADFGIMVIAKRLILNLGLQRTASVYGNIAIRNMQCRAGFREDLVVSSSVMLALELSFINRIIAAFLILISLMVTFAAALSDVDIAIVFPVSTELSRCVITGASSGTAEPLPCVTVCPELSAFTVTLPSSQIPVGGIGCHGQAYALMTSAIILAVSFFSSFGFLPLSPSIVLLH